MAENIQSNTVTLLTDISRCILSTRTSIVAVLLTIYVSLLSYVASVGKFNTNDYYLLQKHNLFNQYGVKLGWFWTCFAVGPFIFFVSKVCPRQSSTHLLRLVVASAGWYFVTKIFHTLLVITSNCDDSKYSTRELCAINGATWHHGIDLSGHLFLMIYSTLIIFEEAKSFAYFEKVTQQPSNVPYVNGAKQFNQIVVYFLIFMCALTLFWFKQMTISILYYHIWFDKVIGTLIAIGLWHFTYNFLYVQYEEVIPQPVKIEEKRS